MSEADKASVDASLNRALGFAETTGATGMWVGIYDPEKGKYLTSVGAIAKDGAEATIADHGRIGSVTKTFTATGILQQVAAGNLALEDTVADVLPELAGKVPEIADFTVEQLLGMTTGIKDYANGGILLEEVLKDPTRVYTGEEIILRSLADLGVDRRFIKYSTTDYLILGEMLSKVTGKPVSEAVTDVAANLGMDNTALPAPDDPTLPDPAATGYMGAGIAASVNVAGIKHFKQGVATPNPASWAAAGGGMYSVLEDMGTWAGTALGTSTLPKDLGDQRLSDASKLLDAGCYGLGIMDFGNGWVGHTGQTLGFEAVIAYNIRTGAALTGFVNEGGSLLSLASVLEELSRFENLGAALFLGSESNTACSVSAD